MVGFSVAFDNEPYRLTEPSGPIVRTAPNEVSFGTCDAAKDIFAVGKGFHKTMFYSVFPPKVLINRVE